MAYKYNELTGEFEDIPPIRKSSSSSSSYSRQTTSTNSRTYASTNQPSYTRTTSSTPKTESKLEGCLGAIGALLLRILPYIIIGLASAMCNCN